MGEVIFSFVVLVDLLSDSLSPFLVARCLTVNFFEIFDDGVLVTRFYVNVIMSNPSSVIFNDEVLT